MGFLQSPTWTVISIDINTLFIYQCASLPIFCSPRLQAILTKHNLIPIAIWENLHLPTVKLALYSRIKPIAGVYIIINLINGKMYVGSRSLGRMHLRFQRHLLSGRGSKLV
jgi:hypothetical protein